MPNKIREALVRRNLTQAALARKTGLDVVSISRFVSGRVEPSVSKAMRIAKALKMNVEDLFGTQTAAR